MMQIILGNDENGGMYFIQSKNVFVIVNSLLSYAHTSPNRQVINKKSKVKNI